MTDAGGHDSSSSEQYDCVVIGGGVAGLSATMVLGRARRRTLLFDVVGQSNRAAPHVGGLLGHDGTPPDELYDLARKQNDAYPAISVKNAVVSGVQVDGDDFVLRSSAGETRARALILATGMDYEVPSVPGFSELWGDQVFHCPFCHGWNVRDRRIAVYAPPEIATRLETLVGAWTDEVTVVDPNEVSHARVDAGTLRALVRQDGTEVACDAVLAHAPLRERGRLAQDLGLQQTEEGFIVVDPEMHTSLPGVYAAGDVAVAPQQVAIAMGSGHTAGLVAVRELMLGRPT